MDPEQIREEVRALIAEIIERDASDVSDETPLRDLGPVTARWFASAAELEAMLRESDVAAVYSEMYFDRRLSRCGKSAFSIQDLGFIGLDGALSMLRRMRSRCEASFYRSYGRYLGSAFGPG